MPQPCIKLVCLRAVKPQLELPLDHPNTCITQEKLCILRMQGSLTPYLKLRNYTAYLLMRGQSRIAEHF
jgi:hypothetical protein